jgi:hypothetical protein
VSPTPLGGADTPRQPAPPPLFGEATPPAARPPGPTTALLRKSTGGLSQARQTNPPRGRGEADHGTDRPTPLGGAARRTRTGFGGIGARRGPTSAPRSTTGATRGTTAQTAAPPALFGAPRSHATHRATERDPGPTPAPAQRPPRGPTSRQRQPPPRRRPPRGPPERQRHPPRASPPPGQRPPRGPLERQRHPPPPRRRPPRGPLERQRHRDELLGARRSPKHGTIAPQPGRIQKPKEASSNDSAATPSCEQRTTWWLKALRLADPPNRTGRTWQHAQKARRSGKEQREGIGRGDTVQLPGREKLRRVCAIEDGAAAPPEPSGRGGATEPETWRTPWPVAGCNRPARC